MIIVTFTSKTEIFAFTDRLLAIGIASKIVSVPKEVKIGCGLAVSLNVNYLNTAVSVIKRGGFSTFKAIYRERIFGGRRTLYKIM
ncbi:MAG: DUF3343 domain-containing protein [Clostridia bacterium]|nr:DUF3343 domain-containing protein [Clostridia bacterium]